MPNLLFEKHGSNTKVYEHGSAEGKKLGLFFGKVSGGFSFFQKGFCSASGDFFDTTVFQYNSSHTH